MRTTRAGFRLYLRGAATLRPPAGLLLQQRIARVSDPQKPSPAQVRPRTSRKSPPRLGNRTPRAQTNPPASKHVLSYDPDCAMIRNCVAPLRACKSVRASIPTRPTAESSRARPSLRPSHGGAGDSGVTINSRNLLQNISSFPTSCGHIRRKTVPTSPPAAVSTGTVLPLRGSIPGTSRS